MTAAVLILAHATDAGAAMVAEELACELGSVAVRVVRPEALSLARWSQRVDARGGASTRIELPFGQPLADAGLPAVLNRIRYLPVPRFQRASAKDRDYAGAELQAIVASWLNELGERVVHSVRRHPWVTPTLPLQHWASAAAAAGLPVAARTIATSPHTAAASIMSPKASTVKPVGYVITGTVLVAGNEVGGSLASRYGARCLAAASALGFALLEFRFAFEEGDIVLVDADPLPPLFEPWAAAMTGALLKSIARQALS